MSEVNTKYALEHLEILKSGLVVWNEWRQKYPEERPNLSGTDLSFIDTRESLWGGLPRPLSHSSEHDAERLNLSNCNLEGAHFKDAHLSSVNLSYAYGVAAIFERCDLRCAILTGSNFSNAEFSRCNLLGAIFGRSRFQQYTKSGMPRATRGPLRYDLGVGGGRYEDADFSRCQLTRADFTNALIHGARFENADLREVKGFVSDENLMRGAIFGLGYGRLERASDPWVKLKRAYTLPKSVLNLLLLGVFLLPYIASALFWIFLALGSEYFSTAANENLLELNTQEVSIFQLLLGFGSGILGSVTICGLIVYNIARTLLTQLVSNLRDEEEITGVTPKFEANFMLDFVESPSDLWEEIVTIFMSYHWMYRFHQVLSVFYYVTLGLALYNLFVALSYEVTISIG